jgi:hypothetical protein
MGEQIQKYLNPETYTGGGGGGTNATGGGDVKDWKKYPHDGLTYATGVVGTAKGRTQMTVGEAGDEEVAILRNPRSLMMPGGGGGGGGGTPMIFNINIAGGGGELEQKKLDAWARQIAMMVEQSLNRKTSMLGLRNP